MQFLCFFYNLLSLLSSPEVEGEMDEGGSNNFCCSQFGGCRGKARWWRAVSLGKFDQKVFKRVAKMSVQFNLMIVCGRCRDGAHLAAIGIIVVVVVTDLIQK